MVHLARWLWLILPVGLVLGFNQLIVAALTAWHRSAGAIPPWAFFALPFLSVIPPSILAALWFLRRNRESAGPLPVVDRTRAGRDVGLGVLAGLLCVAVYVGSQKALRSLGVAAPDLSSLRLPHHVFFSTVGALIPGIGEELYFRGFLLTRFRDLHAPLVVGLTAVSFSLWHILSPAYLPHTFVIGVILGALTLRTRRLLPAIVAHSLANATAGVLIVNGYV